MRLSKVYYSLTNPAPSGQHESEHHFSPELLWSAVESGAPLDDVHIQHALHCRDCREFVEAFSSEAREGGLTVPELLPILKHQAVTA